MRTVARAAALLAAVLVAALVIAAAVVRLPAIQRWVAAQVSDQLPPGVTIGRAVLTLLPPGVRLTDVSLASGGPQLASVTCRVRPRALLDGRLELGAVVVDGATLSIERDADGSLQLTGPLAGLLRPAPGGRAPAAPVAPGPSLSELPSVTVQSAAVTFIDHAGHGGTHTFIFNPVSLTLTPATGGAVDFTLAAQLAPAGRITAQGSVRVAAEAGGTDHAFDVTLAANALDAHTLLSYLAAIVPGGGSARAQGGLDGSLTLSGNARSGFSGDATITLPSGSMVWDEVICGAPVTLAIHIASVGSDLALSGGHLEIGSLAAGRVAADDVQAAFGVAHRNLELTSLHGNAYGGTWSVVGTVTLAEPPRYDVRLRADGIGCSELLTAVSGEHPEYGCERLGVDVAVRGDWTGADTVAEHAQGSGHVQMLGGTIPSSSIIGALWEALIPVIAVRGGPKRIGAATRVDRLTDSFTLRAARMQTGDLTLVTDDYTVTGTGSIGLDGTLDLDTTIALTAAGMAKLFIMASLPVPDDVPNLPAIPTRITGTFGSPTILPAASQIPLAALRGIFGTVRGAGNLLSEGAGKGLHGLQRELEKVWE